MRHILLFFFILFQFQGLTKTSSEYFLVEQDSSKAPLDSLEFPKNWEGIWTGVLNIYRFQKIVQTLPMELHILPLDSTDKYSWIIIYGEDKIAGKRDYILEPVDTAKGHYLIDEQNSIGLDAFLIGGKFYQRFSVSGNMLLTSTEKRGDQLVWEIISGSLNPIQISGNTEQEGQEIPEVKAYPIKVLQRAILSSKKNLTELKNSVRQ